MRTPLAALLALAVVLAAAPAVGHADDTADVLTRLAEGAQCKDKASPWRAWCPATGWAKGKPGKLAPGVMVGITVAITADGDVAQALTDKVSFVVLGVRKDGKQLRVTLRDVTPESADEATMVAEAIMGVATVLKGKAKSMTLAADLRGFADGIAAKAERTASKTKRGWTWETDDNLVELRQIGKVRVVIETPKDGSGGRFVTILTDKVK